MARSEELAWFRLYCIQGPDSLLEEPNELKDSNYRADNRLAEPGETEDVKEFGRCFG